eukprot:5253250-Amphidinium_carterae.1
MPKGTKLFGFYKGSWWRPKSGAEQPNDTDVLFQVDGTDSAQVSSKFQTYSALVKAKIAEVPEKE